MSTAIHLALRAHAKACSGFPAAFATENVAFDPPNDGSAWAREQFVPQPTQLTTTRPRGRMEGRGLYVLEINGTPNIGAKTLRDFVTDLCEWFRGWAVTLAGGVLLRTADGIDESGPSAGQITNTTGPARCVVTIPYRIEYQLAS